MRSAARARPWRVLINESYRHILSDKPTEYFDERDEQRFNRRGDGSNAMRFDASDHGVQVKAAFIEAANVLQRRLVCFGSRQRSGKQRGPAIFPERIAQIVGHARTRPLQRGGGAIGLLPHPVLDFAGQESPDDLQRS